MSKKKPRKEFFEDIDNVFDIYDRSSKEIERITATAARLLYKIHKIKPDDWVLLNNFKKERFLYYDLANKFFDNKLNYFNEKQQAKIKKRIKPLVDDFIYNVESLDEAAKFENLKYKRYFNRDKKYISSEVTEFYEEFKQTFKFFLPFDEPPSKSEFRKRNLRVYDYIQNAKDEVQADKYGNNKFKSHVSSREIDLYSIELLKYIIEKELKIKINYELIAEALSYMYGYLKHYEIFDDMEAYPPEPIKENYEDMEKYQADFDFYNDTLLYMKYDKMIKTKDAFLKYDIDDDNNQLHD